MLRRQHARLALATAGLSVFAALGRDKAPGRALDALAQALGAEAKGALVSGADLRWEPSSGLVGDAVLGRGILFLARGGTDDTRDVWRARVRLSPEGEALGVWGAHNLTNTPLGDDHELVVHGTHAAFVTSAYGQEQSVTALDLSGEVPANKSETLADRAMAALTNLQQTGTWHGVGRIEVTLESPAFAAALAIDDAALAITLYDASNDADPRRARRAAPSRSSRLDLAAGSLVPPLPGARADVSMHLPKRFSHWTVDTLRAVPWIGPAPVAWLEDRLLAARDAYRRIAFWSMGGSAEAVVGEPPSVPALDTSEASVEEAHWPPPPIPTIWKSAEQGEGEWTPPDAPWLRKVPGVTANAPPPFFRTFVRPDEERPYAKVLLVAMDMRQLELDMEAGVEDPEPLTGPHGSGRIPRDPAIYRRVAAAFNGAFKTDHGHYGMMVHRRVLLPPVPAAATVIVLGDGRVGLGTWGPDRRVGNVSGVDDEAIVSFRQNLDALVDRGQVNPTGRNLWGFTLPGKGAQTERSGLCVTTSGHLLFAWGDDLSATTLARAMKMGGCDYAMHLDMNPYHTGFLFTAIDDLGGKKFKSQLLTPAMSIPADRYIQYAPKDFFYVMVHDATPPSVDGGDAWAPDGGAQPPPHWMPGLWVTRSGEPEGSVELLDVEPGRATWRVRAGALESPAATPLRELSGDATKRVLFAVGAGVALDKRPRGIATDGRLAVPAHGGEESGVLVIGAEGDLASMRASELRSIGEHEDMLELPIVLWDGLSVTVANGPSTPRAVVGFSPSGRVLVARGSFTSVGPLVRALARAGCTRALSLDRGTHATAFLDRAGTASSPRGRYEESVLYAIATPLRPRAFRFEATTAVAQSAKSK